MSTATATPIEGEVDTCTTTPTVGNSASELFKGKRFESVEEAKDFYQEYGAKQGFTIRIRTTRKEKRGSQELTAVRFVCSCEGRYRPGKHVVVDDVVTRRSSHERRGCGAIMNIKKAGDGDYWLVNKFCDEHNHDFASPSKRILLRSQRSMPAPAKKLLHCFQEEGIQLNKVVSLFGETSKLPFDPRDCWNYMRKAREYNEAGDAQSVRDYFKKLMVKDPSSYYAIQQDEKGRAINFFWIDGRSRNSYNVFGDVVSFDTTYRTNKYKMPFAPFTGVNHHGQSILFGCALLENEVEETFVWVFENWLQAMGGKAPISFLTDQDRAMGLALARVMPTTCHRFCIWHIKKKFGEKLGSIYFKNTSFKARLDDCIHKTYIVEDFESQWMKLVEEYGLKENEWLNDLFKIRQRWVPVYFRTTFFAGMMSTQRSESINSFFNRFVTPQTTLKEFVKNYSKAVAKRYEDERKQDHLSRKERVIKTNHHLVEDAAKVYSRYMYNKFVKQFEVVYRLRVDETERRGDEVSLTVRKVKDAKHDFVINMNLKSMEGSCSCHLFESMGIPCKHILAVFVHHYLAEIPSYFILQRWRKDAATSLSAPVYLSHGASHNVSEAVLAGDFCKRTMQLSFMAARSEEGCNVFNEILEKAYSMLREVDDRLLRDEPDPNFTEGANLGETVGETMTETVQTQEEESPLLDPQVSQTKGRTKAGNKEGEDVNNNKRLKSGIEISQQMKKKQVRKCKICNVSGHYATTCPRK